MFPKQHRLDLRQTKFFSRFPHSLQSSTFRLHWKFGTNSSPQAAVIVAKKIVPLSVQRHRLKRVCRAIITPLFPTLPHQLELVVVITKPTFEKKKIDLEVALKNVNKTYEKISTHLK